MKKESASQNQPAEQSSDFLVGLEYGLLVTEFDSLAAQFELAIKIGDPELQLQLAPQLQAANQKLRDAHVALMARLGICSSLIHAVPAVSHEKGLVN
jgi:hypothetical protein